MSSKDLNQGEDYEEIKDGEEFLEDDDVDVVVETLWGIPKNYVFIGGAVLIVLLIGVVVFSTRSTGGKKEEVAADVPIETEDDESFFEDPVLDETITQDTVPVPDIEEIASDDVKLLRAYGYTGDEIDFAIEHNFNVDEMILRAQARMDQANTESWKRTSDVAGEEYKRLMYYTYMGQPKAQDVLDQRTLDPTQVVNNLREVVINSDYEKCPTNGMVLQLKCKIATDTYYWYTVKPSRWAVLPDKGNIVLKITFNTWGAGDYIVGAVETDSTLDTIDSSNTITEVISGEAEATEETDGGSFVTE